MLTKSVSLASPSMQYPACCLVVAAAVLLARPASPRPGSVCSDCVSFGAVWPPPCYEAGLRILGRDIKTDGAETAEQCQVGALVNFESLPDLRVQASCQLVPGCRAWSWHASNPGDAAADQADLVTVQKCYLKAGLENTNRSRTAGWTSGPRNCRVY